MWLPFDVLVYYHLMASTKFLMINEMADIKLPH